MLSPEKDFLLYNANKTIQVPSFMTTASSLQKLSTLRNKSSLQGYTSLIDNEATKNTCNPKYKSEQSELLIKSQLNNNKIIQFIDFCNKKILDDELKRRKKSNDQQNIINHKLSHYHSTKPQFKILRNTKSNFTLPQMQQQEIISTDLILQKINQNKIDPPSTSSSPQPKINKKYPNFQNYTTKQPIRSFDMIFNVKQLVRLQEKRQKEFEQSQQNDPEFQLEMIKRQNQIQVLMSNTKKLEQLKKASKGILSHINDQDQQAEKIFQDFRHKLDLK